MSSLKPTDFDPIKAHKKLTPGQVRAIVNFANMVLVRDNRSERWDTARQKAFFQGVTCAFFACGNNTDIPGYWLLANENSSVLSELADMKARGFPVDYRVKPDRAKARRAAKKAWKTIRKKAHGQEEVPFGH